MRQRSRVRLPSHATAPTRGSICRLLPLVRAGTFRRFAAEVRPLTGRRRVRMQSSKNPAAGPSWTAPAGVEQPRANLSGQLPNAPPEAGIFPVRNGHRHQGIAGNPAEESSVLGQPGVAFKPRVALMPRAREYRKHVRSGRLPAAFFAALASACRTTVQVIGSSSDRVPSRSPIAYAARFRIGFALGDSDSSRRGEPTLANGSTFAGCLTLFSTPGSSR